MSRSTEKLQDESLKGKDSSLADVETKMDNQELPIDGFDHVEIYAGNAKQAAYYYQVGFGFELVGYSGLETGNRESVSYVLRQGSVTLVISGNYKSSSPIAKFISDHGDGVKCIGFKVKDAVKSYELALSRGAKSVQEPVTIKDEFGIYTSSMIETYGDTIHRFVDRNNYRQNFAPNFKTKTNDLARPTSLMSIDHIVANVEMKQLDAYVAFYQKIFGFYVYQYFDASDISTQYSALVSKVMANKSGTVKLPINEPYPAKFKSQIQEYIDFNEGCGVQHIAITTKDIVSTVSTLSKNGIEFLKVPKNYYETLTDRVGKIDENIDDLANLGILVDRDDDGYLLQIFSKPVQDRPTLFFEIIQRRGAKGFGKGNFQALFESIEREQKLRGNL